MRRPQGERNRLGPLESAIQARDLELLIRTVRSRCEIDDSLRNPCWFWRGARSSAGYAYMGRAGTNRIVHRVVAWAEAGFPGQLSLFPQVHHTCGVRSCVNPAHLVPVTAYRNVLERSVRNALLDRIRALTDALRDVSPEHWLLTAGWGDDIQRDAPASQPLRGTTYESRRAQLQRLERKTANAVRMQRHEEARFREVIEVDSLVAKGMSKADARDQVGISRSAYDDWRPRLLRWLSNQVG